MAKEHNDIAEILKAAGARDLDAKEAYHAAHIAEMDIVADAMIERGPLPNYIGRKAFLFAIHGVQGHWRNEYKSPEQVRYEEIEKRFGTGLMNHVFSLSTDARHDQEPFQLFAYHTSQYNAWLGDERPRDEEFSAVEYEITKEYDTYIGRVAVPASSIHMTEFNIHNPDAPVADASTIRQTQAMILKVKRVAGADRSEVSVPFDGKVPEVRFGKQIASWAEKQYGMGYYIKILQNIDEAEKLLTKPTKAKESSPS